MARTDSTQHISLQIVEHGVGFIYVTSPDLEGFNLWGPPDDVEEQIVPTIKGLFRHNRGMEVEVLPGTARLDDETDIASSYEVRLAA